MEGITRYNTMYIRISICTIKMWLSSANEKPDTEHNDKEHVLDSNGHLRKARTPNSC